MSKIDIQTFGCRLNSFESEIMRAHADAADLDDAVIINTCAVTSEAVRQARQAVRKARRARPDAKIIVTGCAAQVDSESFAQMPEVDRILGNEEKLLAASFLADDTARVQVNDIMGVKEIAGHLVDGFDGRARAFVQIQQGCDHRCTFCIIPYARGNSRSAPIGAIVEQTRKLVESGYQEVVLTGVDITSYGDDLPGQPSLGQMIRRLLKAVPELPRLRLSSIDSVEVDDELLRLLADEERVMPHLHLSLQAGDDMILKRMKRRHNRQQSIDFCATVRELRPDMVFGADLIAGFPTESDDMFENTLRLVDECGLTYLHVFPYSERPGTPAAKMPQVNGSVRKERARQLRLRGERAKRQFFENSIGQHARVLVEKPGLGHSEQFAPVWLAESWQPGSIADVHIKAATGNGLRA